MGSRADALRTGQTSLVWLVSGRWDASNPRQLDEAPLGFCTWRSVALSVGFNSKNAPVISPESARPGSMKDCDSVFTRVYDRKWTYPAAYARSRFFGS